MAPLNQSKCAYFLVDASKLHPEMLEDAKLGGRQFGVRMVEEVINGNARQPVYGVYHNVVDAKGEKLSNDEDLFKAACERLGVDLGQTDEAAIREDATETADAVAARLRAREEEAVREITKEDPNAPKKPKGSHAR